MTDPENKPVSTLDEARAKAEEAVATAKASMASAVETARGKAKEAAGKATTGVGQNPVAAILGGLAIGAVAAALLPRTAQEDRVAGPVGKKMRDTAKGAVNAARESGMEQLGTLGFSSDAAKDQVRGLVKKLVSAATVAATAAGDSVKK